MTPPAKRLLPPERSMGAASSIATDAPVSRAAGAAHSAPLPFPTTTTSNACVVLPSGWRFNPAFRLEPRGPLAHRRGLLQRFDRLARLRHRRRRQHAPRAILELGLHVLRRDRVVGGPAE